MKTHLKTAMLLFALVLMGTGVYGQDVEFKFDIPTIPDPPQIISVTNSSAVVNSPITVFATINGTEQREVCCKGVCVHECEPNCDWSNCEMTDFTGQKDPRVVPNPTCIPNANDTSGGANATVCGGKSGNPKLFYYKNGDPLQGGSLSMTYDSVTGSFTASIDTTGLIDKDTVTYYIIASDNRGNVISQVPDPDTAPCTTLTSWDTNYETPPLANCTFMNSHEKCGHFETGAATCGTGYSMNDPSADTCNEFAQPIAGTNLDDVIGISGGAGKGFQNLPSDVVICSKIKLGANPPDVGSSSGPIDAYVMIFFNPDIIDPNPNDVWMINATAITYAPEASGADPNLVKVLWDGNCVTNPNTEDPLGCKLIVGGAEVNELKIGAGNAELKFIAKNALPNGTTMLGSSKSVTKAAIATGNIQLDGGTPFWLTDLTAGYAIQKKNQVATLGPPGAPAPPLVPSPATCKSGSTSYTNGTCAQSTSQPASNDCILTIFKSPDSAFTDSYKVYRSTTNNVSGATLVNTITSNRDGQNKSYTDTISTLDGKNQYYWVSSMNVQDGNLETPQNNWAASVCTVEDWVAPTPPVSLSCATPTGQENKCECTWTQDTVTDPSVKGFNMFRDTTSLVTWQELVAAPGATNYSYTDKSAALVLGTPYTYKVATVDAGGNVSSDSTTSCTPEDLAGPGRVDSLGLTLKSGALGVNIGFNAGADEDLAGYNIYKCKNTIPGASCVSSTQFAAVNTSIIAHVEGGSISMEDSAFVSPDDEDVEFCYWVEACDNCDTAGTCPSTGAPNCSTFDTLKTYLKCVMVTLAVDAYAPLYPDNLTTIAPTSGGKCNLEWDKVCQDEEITFPDCSFPDADRMMGYYIMRAESAGSDCTGVLVDTNPVQNSLGHLKGIEPAGSGSPDYTDSGLTNGTTYCYRVHAYDAANNFSREVPSPNPVACTPQDTEPPAAPAISSLVESDVSCSIGWGAVTDADTVTYNLYRCDNTPANCTSKASYSALVTASTNLSENDFTVMTGDSYTFCVTSTDGSANESDMFDGEASPADTSACTRCRAIEVPDPPTAVSAEASGAGFNVWWTDAGGLVSIAGYNVYSCTGNTTSDPATDCTSEISGDAGSRTSGSPLNQATANGSGDVYIAVTSESDTGTESAPAFSSSISLGGVVTCPNATCDTGETMTTCIADCPTCASMANGTDCATESTCEWTGTACQVKSPTCPSYTDETSCTGASCVWNGSSCEAGDSCGNDICDGDETSTSCAADCTEKGFCVTNPTDASCTATITLSGSFKKIVVESCTSADSACKTGSFKKTEVGHQGIVIELVDPNNQSTVIASQITDSNGQIDSFKLSASSDITPGSTYKIRAKYPTGTFDAPMAKLCTNATTTATDGFCVIDLAEKAIGSTDTVSVSAKKVAAPGGDAFGGPMGDPSGDGSVNLFDISAMKSAFGLQPTDTCYKAWADLNLDGTVNLFDLTVIKEHMGEQFDKTGGYAPSLSKTADDYSGDTACCKTNTCP